MVQNAYRHFPTYHTTWKADAISVGVDGKTYLIYKNPGKTSAEWPFDTPHFILINLAIGGDMTGKIDNKIFPVTMAIDHVQVYQKRN